MAMDQDGDGDMGMDSPAITSSVLGGDGRGYASEYSFGMSGSGGIGFGPGAEEDSEMMDEGMAYPSELQVTPFWQIMTIIDNG